MVRKNITQKKVSSRVSVINWIKTKSRITTKISIIEAINLLKKLEYDCILSLQVILYINIAE